MAIDFPNSPANGALYTAGGKTWQWNGTYWAAYGTGPVLRTSDTPPASPNAGDLWYETDTGRFFTYIDSFWVEIGSAADVLRELQPSQVTALSAVTSLTSDDVFPVVDGPSSAVASSKITWGNVQSSITSTGTLGSLAVTGDITRGGVSMPRGIMGRAVRDNIFSLTTTLTDVGISVTFNAVAGRYYKYTAYNYASDSTAGLIETNITDSANTYKSGALMRCDGPGSYVAIINEWVTTEPAGSITVKLRAKCSTGTGTMYGPIWLTVEDIGVF